MIDPMATTNMCLNQGTARFGAPPWASQIHLITAEELAHTLRFDGLTSAFRRFCKHAGIKPVPGRKDCYDPFAVRCKLNEIQGLTGANEGDPQGALTRSKMRRNG